MILILKSGIFGIVFLYACLSHLFFFTSCMSLLPMHLSYLNHAFIYICQCPLTFNAPVFQFVRLLIDYNIDIDSWDCCDVVFYVIGTVCHIDTYFTYFLSILPLCQCYLLPIITYIDILLYRYLGLLVLCSVCYCSRTYLYAPPPPLLLMSIYLLYYPPINESSLCSVDKYTFFSNANLCPCFCIFIKSNIYNWDCWYCVLSVLATVRPVDASFLYVLSMNPAVWCSTDVSLIPFFPSVDRSIDQSINQ